MKTLAIICLVAAFLFPSVGRGENVKAEIAPWPHQAQLKESFPLDFRGAVFSIPKGPLLGAKVNKEQVSLIYQNNPFQGIGLMWYDNHSFMKRSTDEGKIIVDRYPFAKTPQEYFEKMFFLKDAQGKLVDKSFLKERKSFEEDHKAYIKYIDDDFQIYRIIYSDSAAKSGAIQSAFIFGPSLKDGFVQLTLTQWTPEMDKKIFERLLFSLRGKD